MSEKIVELIITKELKAVLEHCEVVCVVGCCGLDAYNFSPMHMASHFLMRNAGEFTNKLVNYVIADLEQLIKIADRYDDSSRVVCFIRISDMDQNFSKSSLRASLMEVHFNLLGIEKIAKLTEEIRYKKKT